MRNWSGMFPPAIDWATISSLATAGGTLVLAVATFASVRSANRSARVAEHAGGAVYLAISLRNVGAGIGVCQGWTVTPGLQPPASAPLHTPESAFRTQSRDLYVPAGDIGMWQGALRDPGDPVFADVVDAIEGRQAISIELLYSDQVGRQRMITRFGLIPVGEGVWLAAANRHWFLDRPGPRSEPEAQAASESILRLVEAAAQEANWADGAGADDDLGLGLASPSGQVTLGEQPADERH